MTPQLTRVTIIGCSILFLLYSANCFFLAVVRPHGMGGNILLGTLSLGLGVAIFRKRRGALRLTAALFLIIAIVLPIGVLNPFTAGDYVAAGKEPPSVGRTLLWLIPLEILFLAIVFLIDPKRMKKQEIPHQPAEDTESEKETAPFE